MNARGRPNAYRRKKSKVYYRLLHIIVTTRHAARRTAPGSGARVLSAGAKNQLLFCTSWERFVSTWE